MGTLWRWTKAFGHFWYGFVIGDDWVGAAGVLVLIGGTWGLVWFHFPAIWFGPLVIVLTSALLVHRALVRKMSG